MPFWSILSKAFGLLPVLTSGSNKRTEKQDRVDPGKDFKPFLKPAEYTSSDFQTSFPQFFSTLDSAPYTPNHPTQSQCRSWWRRRSLRSSGWWSRCRGWSSTSGTHSGKSFSSPFFWRRWTFGLLWELDSTSRPPGRAPGWRRYEDRPQIWKFIMINQSHQDPRMTCSWQATPVYKKKRSVGRTLIMSNTKVSRLRIDILSF